jgi:threonine/homoserine/homoserine lactone efflux protein
LLATSSVAFAVVKWLGAAYLLYLGVRLLLEPAREIAEPAGPASHASTGAAFRQGMLTNLLNPKVALFFLALMPQFIAAESPHKVLAFLALGATFVTTGTVWCLCLALASGQLRRALLSRPALGRVFSRVAGGSLSRSASAWRWLDVDVSRARSRPTTASPAVAARPHAGRCCAACAVPRRPRRVAQRHTVS